MRQHIDAVPAPNAAPMAEVHPAWASPICLASRAEGEASNPEMLASVICLASRAGGEASNPEMLASVICLASRAEGEASNPEILASVSEPRRP